MRSLSRKDYEGNDRGEHRQMDDPCAQSGRCSVKKHRDHRKFQPSCTHQAVIAPPVRLAYSRCAKPARRFMMYRTDQTGPAKTQFGGSNRAFSSAAYHSRARSGNRSASDAPKDGDDEQNERKYNRVQIAFTPVFIVEIDRQAILTN